MANSEHLQILQQGVKAWNAWRENTHVGWIILSDADFRNMNLREAHFRDANLFGAKLSWAHLAATHFAEVDLRDAPLVGVNLSWVNLIWANLTGAHLRDANLTGANLTGAHLRDANLTGANLRDADLTGADFTGADLSGVYLHETVFSNTDLTDVRGLETCAHAGPSTLDHRTLAKSGSLPLAFLRGCGLPDTLIDYIPSLLNEPVQFYSCFISYASKDDPFAKRLHADLQNNGVRCWFAPKDLPIGAKILASIDESIRLYDKLLLILSKSSVKSQWVEGEVATALARERQQGTTVLFPVRIDNTVMTLETGWPALIRNTRNIGDFRRWKTHDVYQQAFDQLLRDLKAESGQPHG